MSRNRPAAALRSRSWPWSLGWCLTGIGLLVGDVFSLPRYGPLWAAFVLGAAGWGVAGGGAAALPRSRRWGLGLAWAAIFCACLALGLRWGVIAEARGGAGFEGLVAASALGGAAGGLIDLWAHGSGSWLRALARTLLWGLLFLVATCVAVITGYVIAHLAKALLAPLIGDKAALALGWGLGWGVGGALAGLASRLDAPATAAAARVSG